MSCGVLARGEVALGSRGHGLSRAKERVDVLTVAWSTRSVGRRASRLCGGSQRVGNGVPFSRDPMEAWRGRELAE